MSGRAVGIAFGMEGLTPTEKYVLVAYAEHADQDGANIFPAVASIAAKTGLSRRSVQRATRKLEALGILMRDGKGPKRTQKWKLNLAWRVSESHPDRQSRVTESPKGGDSLSQGGDSLSQRGDSVTPEPSFNRQLINRPLKREGAHPKFSTDELVDIHKKLLEHFCAATQIDEPRFYDDITRQKWHGALGEIAILVDWNVGRALSLISHSVERMQRT